MPPLPYSFLCPHPLCPGLISSPSSSSSSCFPPPRPGPFYLCPSRLLCLVFHRLARQDTRREKQQQHVHHQPRLRPCPRLYLRPRASPPPMYPLRPRAKGPQPRHLFPCAASRPGQQLGDKAFSRPSLDGGAGTPATPWYGAREGPWEPEGNASRRYGNAVVGAGLVPWALALGGGAPVPTACLGRLWGVGAIVVVAALSVSGFGSGSDR